MALDDPKIRQALDDDGQLPRMSFGDHLDELRARLVKGPAPRNAQRRMLAEAPQESCLGQMPYRTSL